MEKPWILEIPILKTLAISLLLLHIVAVPLIFCFTEYPAMFNNTDFIKLIFITTSFGAVFTSGAFAFLILTTSVLYDFRLTDLRRYENLLIELITCFLAVDFSLVLSYYGGSNPFNHKRYMGLFFLALVADFIINLIKLKFKRTTEQAPTEDEA